MARNTLLEVYCGERAAGSLYRSDLDEQDFLFSYARDCDAAEAVSLTMPVVRDPYDSTGGLLPIFEMNLPEGALLERLRHLFAKTVSGFDALELLAILGRSQIGRVRYARVGAALEDMPARSLAELLAYTGAEDLFEDLLRECAPFSGVSGVQPKVLLRSTEAVLPRATHRGATHIVKAFNPREYPELAANEYFCMRAALHAGIAVPEVHLSENRAILAVKRFDLVHDGGYLGCEDFCVLNGLRPHGRYEGSYEGVARRIVQFVSPSRRRDALEQFFSTVALSCAIGNGDAHLKNFAVLYKDATSEVSLAPAYDLVSTTFYTPRDILALTLGNSKEFPDRKRLAAFGRQTCNLGASKVAELLDRVAGGVGKAATELRAYIKHHRDFREVGERLVETLETGLRRSTNPAR